MTTNDDSPGFDPLSPWTAPKNKTVAHGWEPGGEMDAHAEWASMSIPEIVARRVAAMRQRGIWFRLERDVAEQILRKKHSAAGLWAMQNDVELRRGSIYLDEYGNEVDEVTDKKRYRLYARWLGDLPLEESEGPKDE